MKVTINRPSWSLLPLLACSVLVSGLQAQTGTPPKPKKAADFPPPPQFNVTSPLMTIAEKEQKAKAKETKAPEPKKPAEVAAPAKPASAPTPPAKVEAKPAPAKVEAKPAPAKPSSVANPVMREPAAAPKAPAKPANAPAVGTTIPLEPAAPNTLLPKPGAKPAALPTPPMPADLANVPVAEPFVMTRTTQLVGSLNGITLFSDTRKDIDDIPNPQPQSLGTGVNLIGLETPKPDDLKELLRSKYLGKPLTFEKLDAMVKDILGYYTTVGRPMTHVYIPEQEITDRVKIAVLEGRFGEVKEVVNEGRVWYETDDIQRSVHLQQGEIIDTQSIANAMRGVNSSPWSRLGQIDSHPFRRVTATFLPGSALGMTDLKMDVEDRLPVRGFVGYDNTGPALLGEHRFSVGGVWYDVAGLGWNHQLGVQIQSDIEFERFHALLVNYQIPILAWGPKQYIQVFAGYMSSKVEIPAGAGFVQGLEGTNLMAGLRYHFGLPDWFITKAAKEAERKDKQFALYHEIGIGLDYKSADNNFAFGGVPVFGVQTDIVQAVIEYNARQTDPMGETSLNLSLYWSPGGLTSNNSDVQFQAARQGSTTSYFYGRGTIGRKFDLPFDMLFQMRGTIQWANENLLASEQLGLGGYDTVRGYSERIARGDLGFFAQLELYSPPLHPLRSLAKRWPDRWVGKDNSDDELRFLVFFDYGQADVVNFTAAEPGGITMMSAGVGLRYRFNRSLTLRADYGVQLEKLDPNQFFLVNDPIYSFSGDSYAHIGLTFTF